MARGWPLVGRIVVLAPWLAFAGPAHAQQPPSERPPGALHSPGPSPDARGCPDVHRLRDELDRLRDAVSRARDREERARAGQRRTALAAIDRIEAQLRADAGPPPPAKGSPPRPSAPSRASIEKLRREVAQLRARVAERSGSSGEMPSARAEEDRAEEAERAGRNPPPAPRRDETARASLRAPRSGPFDGTIEARSGDDLVVRRPGHARRRPPRRRDGHPPARRAARPGGPARR